MYRDQLSLLFDEYVKLLHLFNGNVFIPIHQGRACNPVLSFVYRLDENDCGPQCDGACGAPCFSMPSEDLVKQILTCVGPYGGLRGRVEDGVIVELESTRYHIPRKRN